MGTYILRRLLLMIPTLIGMTFLIFMIVASSPQGIGASLQVSGGGQREATSRAMQEAYLEDRYGLGDRAPVQYARWLGRVSPIKIGTRGQVTPGQERISAPKPLTAPLVLDWFGVKLADPPAPQAYEFPPEAVFEKGMDDEQRLGVQEERTRAYRIASNQYARARSAFVVVNANYEVALGRMLRDNGHTKAVKASGKPINKKVKRVDHESLDAGVLQGELHQTAQAAADAYLEANEARVHLDDVFDAKPFREVGIGIPGVPISIASPDLGKSFSRSRPVSVLIMEALPRTLLLNFIAFPLIYLIAIPSGMLAAARSGKLFDVLSGGMFVALWSIPIVWAGTLAIGYLANNDKLGWFPVTGLHDSNADLFTFMPTRLADGSWHRGFLFDTLWHVVLPVACLSYGGFAVLSKQTRAAMLDNFNADYVRTAKAKGLARRDIVLRHVFRNSLLPLITMFVSIFPALLAGSVVVERIFSIQGMGSLLIESITLGDRELLLAIAFVVGLVNVLALLLADILYALADPRITFS